LTIGWGINLLGFVPFSVLGVLIFVNNFLVAAVLTPLLLFVLYPRVKRGRLLYKDILRSSQTAPRLRRRFGLALAFPTVAAGMLVGYLLSTGALEIEFLTAIDANSSTGALKIGIGLLPVVILLLIAIALM
jgi:energy-coupling factor transport system substrate-specific component